jgi:hypothetical protein
MFFTQTLTSGLPSWPVAWTISIWLAMRSCTTLEDASSEPVVRLTAGSTALITATIAAMAAMVSRTVLIALSMTPLLQRPLGHPVGV